MAPPHNRLRVVVLAVGVVIILAALMMNRWSWSLIAGHGIVGARLQQVHAIQLFLAATGFALLLYDKVIALAKWLVATRPAEYLLVLPRRGLVIAVLPLAISECVYWVIACWCEEVPLLPVTCVAFLQSILLSSLLYVLVAIVLAKCMRLVFIPCLVAVLWAAVVPFDTAMYYFGNTRLESHHLGLATSYSLSGFVGTSMVLLFLTCGGLPLLAGVLTALQVRKTSWHTCLRVGSWLVLLWLVDFAHLTYWASWMGSFRHGAILDRHYQRLEYIATDPVLHLIGEVVPHRQSYRKVNNWSPFAEAIQHYHLPIGRHEYKSLEQRPLRRIVLVLSESLSAFFIRTYNPELPGSLMPFLETLAEGKCALSNYRTSAQPTLPALAVTYCSHPNYTLAFQARFPQSFVQHLGEAGWHTVFMNSVSKFYDDQGRKATAAGFQAVFGSEDIARDPGSTRYISGWGACDRVLFLRAREYLSEHRNRPVFMALLTCDTHTPVGRKDYCGIQYPTSPEWINRYPNIASHLQSVFRQDYDLRLFVDDLKRSDLFDEDTLVIITADHCCPSSPLLSELPGAGKSPFERIPFIFLSPRSLPPFRSHDATSQLDLGPSLLHLVGISVPAGSWGRSIFSMDGLCAPFVGIFRGVVTISANGTQEEFETSKPTTALQGQFSDLLNSYQ